LSVLGGYDTQGRPGHDDATDEEIATEVHRCLDEYGKYGHSYGFMGFRLGNMRDPRILGGAYQYAQELAAARG